MFVKGVKQRVSMLDLWLTCDMKLIILNVSERLVISMNRISKTKAYLREMFDKSEHLNKNPIAKMYRYEHTLRVAHWGERIALASNLDIDALVVGCLLHDLSYIEPMPSKEAQINHGRYASQLAEAFVMSLGFDEKVAKDILYGIAIHVDGVSHFTWRDSILAESISDADNLDRFDAYRIYEILEITGYSSKSLSEKINYCEKQIDNIHHYQILELATPYATDKFREQLDFMLDFYMRLHHQCQMSY